MAAALTIPAWSIVAAGDISHNPDIPANGISYTNGVDTINVGDGVDGITNIDDNVVGIALIRTGTFGAHAPIVEFNVILDYDINPDDTSDPLKNVVSLDGLTPLLFEGDYIFSDGEDDPTYTIGPKNYTGLELAELLTAKAEDAAGTITGSLTVNNNGPFNTTNADGIFVKSTGGNGGNGGCSSILFYTWCDDGKCGGDAGSVAVNSNAGITVSSTLEGKAGISAISQGGKGGNGGGAFGLFASDAGAGGSGGQGALVYVGLGEDSSIVTNGKKGHGVYAKSHGGDGGSGGNPSSLVALGSKGGSGGDAGNVMVDNDGSILTSGAGANGIHAISLGAGAGSGSDSGGFVAIGGNGGGYSDGARVTVNNSGLVETKNSDAVGLLAQSIGGGGGDGGDAGGLFTVGGKAGSGGNANKVTILDAGSVQTIGDRSTAIFAQSIGGGGGNGGDAISFGSGISVAVGGDGGLGGDGHDVEIAAAGSDIDTQGNDAHGIHGQSIGGGGGKGGLAVSGSISTSSPISASIALGGNGGGGGNAGETVTINTSNSTDIDTAGINAIGISAQSIGGGGGNGGSAYTASGGALNVSVGIGGKGGVAGDGKRVIVNNAAAITTIEKLSTGILAQSVGGGGGNGGFTGTFAVGGGSASVGLGGKGGAGGSSGSVEVINTNTIDTEGDSAIGILAQSVGGGGGNGGSALAGSAGVLAVSTSVGGAGGDGNDSGAVVVEHSGDITTAGNKSHGIFGQSVGGGGGNGGFALSGALAVSVEGIPAGAAAISVGGKGGGASRGGNVTLDIQDGLILTEGLGAHALYAQSIGGGGGDGGFAGSLAVAVGSGGALGVSIGGSGSNGGDSGEVRVISQGRSIITLEDGSDGIHAQSIGGGGGDGGFAFSGSAGFSAGTNLNVSVAVGGSGGNGGEGNLVDADNHTDITTLGEHANGIFAQSVGGGGGNGGLAVSGNLSLTKNSGSAGVTIGGGGGNGNIARNVEINNYGKINTFGTESHGLFGQSIGGSGGNGGLALTGQLVVATEKSAAAGVSVGGGGGSGNEAGMVRITNHTGGQVFTRGNGAHGIIGQSVGGGGGNGDMAIVGQAGLSTGSKEQEPKTLNIGVSIGGEGGEGGFGNTVTITNEDAVFVTGDTASGIVGQSIGGGGGNGGTSLTGTFGGAQTKNLSVGVGGSGGNGGYGQAVTVINKNVITTSGNNASGIRAQSIGGGGGNGGDSVAANFGVSNEKGANWNIGVAVGGGGGDGNFAGTVDVDNVSAITTLGTLSHGILAQSTGGGGGNGGSSLSATVTLELDGSTDEEGKKKEAKQPVNVSVAVGGSGGKGSHGGKADVLNSGSIITLDHGSRGIFAQSVGGGGGSGGSARALTVDLNPKDWIPGTGKKKLKERLASFAQDFFKTMNVAVGGNGGGASNGGVVDINNTGRIITLGDEADAIFAQSVGGGGGVGGDAAHGIPLDFLGEIDDLAPSIAEVLLEFTPLKGLEDLQIVVGGSAGSCGDGQNVEVINHGAITTFGKGSNGIFAQSVGGGGGIGGKAALGLVGVIGIGGEGGAAGDGREVKINHNGRIETWGAASNGLVAQSVGGGGGIAGNVDRGLLDFGIGLGLARDGGGGGNGGLVKIESHGSIITHGPGAIAVFAQSVGGGGGVTGDTELGPGFAGTVGGLGSAGAVDISLTGDVLTSGSSAHGLFAQSAGGRQGENDDITYLGIGAAVDVRINGDIRVQGEDAHGIVAQSVGLNGAGRVTISIDGGGVQGGSGSASGIVIKNGTDNTLTNRGYISAASGSAIIAESGNETIHNHGTITGSVNLGSGDNTFTNRSGSIFNSGTNAHLGNGRVLTNSGTLSPGGPGTVIKTNLTGDLVQTNSGNLYVDLDLKTEKADHLDVSGSSTLDGALTIAMVNSGWAKPGALQHTIYSSDEDLVDSGLTLLFLNSPLVDCELSQPNPGELSIRTTIDYSPKVKSFNQNQRTIGKALNRLQLAGGSKESARLLSELFTLPDEESIGKAYDNLSPESLDASTTTTFEAAQRYTQTLVKRIHSIRSYLDTSGVIPGAQQSLPYSLWAEGFAEFADQDTNQGFTGFDYELTGGVIGLDRLFKDGLLGGLSYGQSNTTVDLNEERGGSEIQSTMFSLYGSMYSDKYYLDFAFSYARESIDSVRQIQIGGTNDSAFSNHDGNLYSLYAQAGYNVEMNNLMLQPFAAFQYSRLYEDAYRESGTSGLNLVYDDQETDALISDIGVRLTKPYEEGAWIFIPEISLAWRHNYDVDSRNITVCFEDAPATSFTTKSRDIDQNGILIGAGIMLLSKSGFSMHLRYDGERSGDFKASQLSGGLRYEF